MWRLLQGLSSASPTTPAKIYLKILVRRSVSRTDLKPGLHVDRYIDCAYFVPCADREACATAAGNRGSPCEVGLRPLSS